MKYDNLFATLTHEELLQILPFGCTYAWDNEGEPFPVSVTAALMLQSVAVLIDPMAHKHNNIPN